MKRELNFDCNTAASLVDVLEASKENYHDLKKDLCISQEWVTILTTNVIEQRNNILVGATSVYIPYIFSLEKEDYDLIIALLKKIVNQGGPDVPKCLDILENMLVFA